MEPSAATRPAFLSADASPFLRRNCSGGGGVWVGGAARPPARRRAAVVCSWEPGALLLALGPVHLPGALWLAHSKMSH